mgnify:CR=1 FL=1
MKQINLKQVWFNEDKRCLVDKQGKKYSGERFSFAYGNTRSGTYSIDSAIGDALLALEKAAMKKRAEAYEIVHKQTFDSHQEYDARPYSAQAGAILYRKK